MSKIKEYFQNLVKAGIIPQSPMNYDAETLKIYIDHLEEENAALRDRMNKTVMGIAERIKMAFYYEFDELIPSIMADRIDELVKEVCGDEQRRA